MFVLTRFGPTRIRTARPDLSLGLLPPLESIVAGVAREMRGCLARGEGERVDVLLTLLEALGGESA